MEELKNLSRYLSSPKSTDELYDQLKDEDSNWKKSQLELYLNLNKNVKKESETNKWKIGEKSKEEELLAFVLERVESSNRGIVRVDKLINELPYGLAFTQEQIISVVNRSDYLTAPNKKVITKKK